MLYPLPLPPLVVSEAALALATAMGVDEELLGHLRFATAVVVALYAADRLFLPVYVVALTAVPLPPADGTRVDEEILLVRLAVAMIPQLLYGISP